jgi:hypothetical protein
MAKQRSRERGSGWTVIPSLVELGSLTLNVIQVLAVRSDRATEFRPTVNFELADDEALLSLFSEASSPGGPATPPGLAQTDAAARMKDFVDRSLRAALERPRDRPVASFVSVCDDTKNPINDILVKVTPEVRISVLRPNECVFAALDLVPIDSTARPLVPPRVIVSYERGLGTVEVVPSTPVVWMQGHLARAMPKPR